LRVGEDVDLVWRLVAAGWTVRYAPELTAVHIEPRTRRARLDRSRRYGTAAGPLARRHPTAPLSPRAVPAAVVLLALVGRPRLASALLAGATIGPVRKMRAAGVPARDSVATATTASLAATSYAARWLTQLWSPALGVLAVRAIRRRDRAAAIALVAMLRPRLVDDIAYGAGVWTGCLRARSWRPLILSHGRSRRPLGRALRPRPPAGSDPRRESSYAAARPHPGSASARSLPSDR